MNIVSAYSALGVPGAVLPPGGVTVSDFYCVDIECDCRMVVLAVRREPKVQEAAVAYRFGVSGPEAVGLADDYVQGATPLKWLARVEAELLAARAQRALFEARYLALRAALLDPMEPDHFMVRGAAKLPALHRPTPPPPPPRKGRGRITQAELHARNALPPRPSLAPVAAPLLTVRNVQDLLTGAELLTIAMVLGDEPVLTVPATLAVLHRAGLPERNERKLAEKVFQSSRSSGRFARPEEATFKRLPYYFLERGLDAIVQRPEIRGALASRRLAAVPLAKPAVPAPTAVDVQPVPPAAPVVVVPATPPAPSFAPAPRPLPEVSRASVVEVAERPSVDPLTVRLTLDAWRLASAAQFDELLALASMRDVTPHRYQTETVRRVLRALRGRAILADEVGLGKTIEALMILREYQVRGMVRRALILVPPPLVAQWEGELSQKAGITARTTDDPLLRTDPEKFWGEPGVVVASLALARGAKHAPNVLATTWDLLVVDEAHHIKNRGTLAYKLVSELKRRFLLLVTATPVENDLEEIYNLVTLLRPGQFASPAAFRARFVDPKDPTRPKDKNALRALLGEVMVRNTRAQSGLALPPRFVSTVTVDPSPAEKSLYDAVMAFVRTHHAEPSLSLAATTLLLEAGSSARAVRATLHHMTEKRMGPGTGELRGELHALAKIAGAVEDNRKVDALLQIVATRREPVLVFTRFRETLTEVVAAVERSGVTAVAFHGGLDEAARRASLARFRAGGAVVMVATAAGSEGHNLQSCAVLVNFDLPWNPMAIEQRIGRLHRMGQTRDVHVYNLCAKGTIEERVLDVLDRRVQLFQLVVGEMDMVLGNLADERDLEDWLVAAVARAKSDAEVDATFDRLADELLKARGQYEKTRALDDALFGKDFEA